MNKTILTMLIIFLIFGVTQVNANSVVKPPDYNKIIKESDYVFIGFPIEEGKTKKINEASMITVWEIMPYITLKGNLNRNEILLRTSGGSINEVVLPGVNLKIDKMYIFLLKRSEDPFLWDTVNDDEVSIRPVKKIEYNIGENVIQFENIELVNALDNYIKNSKLNKYKIREVK